MSGGKVVNILLVEDNPGDVELTREALSESSIESVLHVVVDGVEAIDFLRKQGEFKSAVTPDIILLDLNLPRKDGREVLSEIKTDPEIKRIPVVILTTSDAESDIIRTYDDHANCYIKKPVDLNTFIEVVKKIEGFWFSIVKLPDQE